MTDKSWNTLLKLKKEPIWFILIGGWAVFLHTKQMKSKDIDIIITDFNDLSYLKQKYELKKNDRLRKYEIKMDDIDIDIYLIHYSQLGMPIEEIRKNTSSIKGINVPKPEVLLILKQAAESARKDSVKGKKDQIDIMTLLFHSEIDFKQYKELLEKQGLQDYLRKLKTIIKTFKDIKYINFNPREFKLRKQAALRKLETL